MSGSLAIDIDEAKPIKSQDELQDGSQVEDKSRSDDPKMMEISPNGTYLVTYHDESKTIVGWNVGDDNTKQDNVVEVDCKRIIYHMCVSNEKILAYIDDHDISMYNVILIF